MTNRIKIVTIVVLLLCLSALHWYINTNAAVGTRTTPATKLSKTMSNESNQTSNMPIRTTSQQPGVTRPPVDSSIEIKPYPDLTLEGNLSTHFSHLLARFNASDMVAALILGVNLQKCFHIASTEQQLAQQIQQLHDRKSDIKGTIESSRRAQFEFCRDIPAPHRDNYFHFINAAAQSGYPPAQGVIANTVNWALYDQSFKRLSDRQQQQRIEEYQAVTHKLLKQGAKSGDLLSIISLSEWHRTTLPGRKTDLVQALAYSTVFLEFISDNDLYQKHALIREHTMTKQMTAAQIDQAYNISNRLLAELQRNGTIYAYPPNSPLEQ